MVEASANYRPLEEGKCIFCGSEDIEGGFIEVVGKKAYQKMWCLACENPWEDVYVLTSWRRTDNIREGADMGMVMAMDMDRLQEELTEAFINYQNRLDNPMPLPDESRESLVIKYQTDPIFHAKVCNLVSGVLHIVSSVEGGC